ncbi:MAG: putative quinol monooxygenase [Synoicihabitans sp.]
MSTTPLTIVAIIKSTDAGRDLVKAELQKLIAPTLQEAGCIQYDLHQDNDDPNTFLYFENWENRDLWQDHLNSPHIAALKANTGDALASVTVHEMTQVRD